MDRVIQGWRGGILGLREFVAEHEEAIAADLFAIGRSIHEIGYTISRYELGAWLRHLTESSALVRKLREQARIDATPEDQRVVGGAKGDALPIDELNKWLGWE